MGFLEADYVHLEVREQAYPEVSDSSFKETAATLSSA